MGNDNDMSVWIIGWVGLIVVLTIGTFGLWWSFLIVINVLFCLAGFCGVLWYVGSRTAKRYLARTMKGELGSPRNGLPSLIRKVEQEQFRSYKMDKRLTGASIIDEPLQEWKTPRKVLKAKLSIPHSSPDLHQYNMLH